MDVLCEIVLSIFIAMALTHSLCHGARVPIHGVTTALPFPYQMGTNFHSYYSLNPYQSQSMKNALKCTDKMPAHPIGAGGSSEA